MVHNSLGMVEIIRDFLVIHRSLTELVARHRGGQLRFQAVQDLVGDTSSSVLFRFKERCHAMFRTAAPVVDGDVRTGLLFDLAVGSLFHEAMKLRENLYQHEVYRPRVEVLRAGADSGASSLIEEFDKICAAAGDRIEESVSEAEILLLQARGQLLSLICEQRANGLISRCLYQQSELVAEVYEQGLDALFEEIYGDSGVGYLCVADSFLGSAHFNAALEVLAMAETRAPERGDIQDRIAYAEGMRAFRDRDYARSVTRLSDWLGGGVVPEQRSQLRLALSAISHVESLYEGEGGESVIGGARKLAAQLQALVGSEVEDGARAVSASR
jgi:hypothetical protein